MTDPRRNRTARLRRRRRFERQLWRLENECQCFRGRNRDRECPLHSWLCDCGAWNTDSMHCSSCRAEPPWGCPGECCQGHEDEEYEPDEPGYDPFSDYADDEPGPGYVEQLREADNETARAAVEGWT
jgi:hypothetical protein